MIDVTTWRYHLPSENGEGWAIIFMDSTGCFSALSDWGNYGYRWSSQGWGPGDFREWFVRCNDHYVLCKIARDDCYFGERTARAIKERIVELRRNGTFTREQARAEWRLLVDEHEEVSSIVDFAMWWQRTSIADPHELSVYDFPGQAVAFMKRVMPRLRGAIREQLAAEKPVMDPGVVLAMAGGNSLGRFGIDEPPT